MPLSTVEGMTRISSANGPIVARMRAPRITMPLSLRSTMRAASVGLRCSDDADRAVRLRVDQRVREQQVVVAHVLVVALHVLAVAALVLAEPVGRGGERHQRAVAVVAGAAEGAERELGRDAHRRAAPLDVVRRSRAAGTTCRRARRTAAAVRHHVAQRRVVLEVEELRVGLHDVAQLRDARDGADVALALDLDVDRPLVERLDVLPYLSVLPCALSLSARVRGNGATVATIIERGVRITYTRSTCLLPTANR